MTDEVALPAPLRLDLVDEQAWLGDAPLHLTPKAFAVLRHLAGNRDRLVTKDELFRALWPGLAVSDSVLTTTVREIRKALGEGLRNPGYIKTVHRRGYRFIGDVQHRGRSEAAPTALRLVGREAELQRLGVALDAARGGHQQVLFITGEPGIGKTALIDAFLAGAAVADASIARGQCIERFGAAEAYLPWLEALGQLCRRPSGAKTVALLRRVAPMWLAQLPALLDAGTRAALHREVAGAPPERMLREMCDLLEAVAGDRLLVVVLEDVHWLDQSSLELLAAVARRRVPVRLLVLATYRPVELDGRGHPLPGIKQELQAHGQCAELSLGFLSDTAVADYLGARFPGLPAALAQIVHRRSDGNALFMVNVADYLAARELIVRQPDGWMLRRDVAALEAAVPESLRGMIDRQLGRLDDDDRRLVEAASVAGVEFADASVAAALEASGEDISARCAALARRGLFLRRVADEDWADGTAVRRYAFIHALYAEVLYEALPPSRRQNQHHRVALRLEAGYGRGVGAIAAELATHFERAREPTGAVKYLGLAASNAAQRLAYAEAIELLNRALELLPRLPDGEARQRQELVLRMALAPALMTTRGYAAPEVEAIYERADELCRQVGEDWQVFSVLIGRCSSALLAAKTETAKVLAEESLQLAKRRAAPRYLTQAETALGVTLVWRGEPALAVQHLEASRAAYEAVDQPPPAFRLLHDPGAAGRSYAGWAYWLLGDPGRARREAEAAIALATRLAHPFSLAFALTFATFVDHARRDVEATRQRAEATLVLCAEHGFAMYHAVAMVFRGWVLSESGRLEAGLAEMEAGLVAFSATGAALVLPFYLGVIAEALIRAGRFAEARTRLLRALAGAEATGERVYEAELHRLMGESSRADPAAAEAHFKAALRTARRQRATSFELRAATSLARLWRDAGRAADAQALLAPVVRRIAEGDDTIDLRDAAAVLDRLRI